MGEVTWMHVGHGQPFTEHGRREANGSLATVLKEPWYKAIAFSIPSPPTSWGMDVGVPPVCRAKGYRGAQARRPDLKSVKK